VTYVISGIYKWNN